MQSETKLCNLCFLPILKDEGTTIHLGKDHLHYHNRFKGDCLDKVLSDFEKTIKP